MRRRTGQSTTEFALMIPLIFALLFAVIEYAYYLGAIHYVSYATFAAARSVQANDDPQATAADLLTGRMVDYQDRDVTLSVDPTTGAVSSTFIWEAQTPGFEQIMGIMDVEMTTTLGPAECGYEGSAAMRRATGSTNPYRYSDNRLECH